MNGGKETTLSVRVPSKQAQELEEVSHILSFPKSDFLRSCINKLCSDNKLLLDHYDKIRSYIDAIKEKSSKLKNIRVRNGDWTDVSDTTIYILCDMLWSSAKDVFNLWRKMCDSYDLGRRTSKGQTVEEFGDVEALIELEDMGLLVAEKAPLDIGTLINTETWLDDLEITKATLTYAVYKAMEKHGGAEKIINELLRKMSEEKGEKQSVLTIDAQGRLRRSGSTLILPVYSEPR